MEPRPARTLRPQPLPSALERTPRASFVLPEVRGKNGRGRGDPERSPLSARLRGDGWRALAERVAPGPLDVVDDVRSAVAPGCDLIVIEAGAAAREVELLRRARRWARIVLIADGDAPERTAALARDLDARCIAPSRAARNLIVAKLARHMPTWLALLRTSVIHDPIPRAIGAVGAADGPRPLVTHWAVGSDIEAILGAFRAARARRSDLRLRVLVDAGAAPPCSLERKPAPGVEVRPVDDPGDIVREFAASAGLYHPVESWPDASIAAPALANAVGAPAFVSARCEAAEAVADRGELLASDEPDALLVSQLHVAASREPRRAPVSFGVTDVALRWLEEISAASA